MTIEPVRAAQTVPLSVERAFGLFTEGLGSWWPPENTWSGQRGELDSAFVEPYPGGRWYERETTGAEQDWGRVLGFEPPRLLVLSWAINADWLPEPNPARASEIEVRFLQQASATCVELEHRGFERHGEGGAGIRDAMSSQGGWSFLLDRYAEAAR